MLLGEAGREAGSQDRTRLGPVLAPLSFVRRVTVIFMGPLRPLGRVWRSRSRLVIPSGRQRLPIASRRRSL